MNNFVVADSEKCIGCRTCEIACVLAHSKDGSLSKLSAKTFCPRLKVVKAATLTTPVQCRHCENAPCVAACPKQALVQNDHSVQVVKGACVGCKACLAACPYGAIEIVIAGNSTPRRVEVIKCDLCRDREDGPACIKTCPTNALHKVYNLSFDRRINQRKR
ncbi:MAG: 4Fe-4S ferredoxin, iron-sulpur binding protein [Firmicutes bacterium]|nr:4Fe-4S ferredoxin, iron-sulpur binding protein [Bacillota bacterium]